MMSSSVPGDAIPPVMRAAQASAYLGVAPVTLELWRKQGKGPRYSKPGKIVWYRREDLDAWIQESLKTPVPRQPRGRWVKDVRTEERRRREEAGK